LEKIQEKIKEITQATQALITQTAIVTNQHILMKITWQMGILPCKRL